MTLRLITANEGRHLSVQETRADFEIVQRLNGLTGFQEIDEADTAPEHGLLRAIFGDSHNLYGMQHLVPIAVPKGWEVIHASDVFATGGVKHWSPTRYFTVVTVKKKRGPLDRLLRRSAQIFVVINGHYPAGAFHGERPPDAKRELQRHWLQMYAVHRELVQKFAERRITVFWTADTNRTDMPKTHPRERQVVTVGIDSISYIEGAVKVKLLRKGSRKLHSDHNALYADFKLT